MRFSPILILHISGGMIGLLSGAVAMTLRKGSRGHGTAGTVFVASMLLMSASATYLAIVKHQSGNILGGIFTFYLVTTAWLTARRKDGKPGILDWAALSVALPVGTVVLILGLEKAFGVIAPHDGVPAGMTLFMGSVILLAAAGDVRMLKRGGISGRQRIARHLWRMCFGLFIATGSFFLSQAMKLFPVLTAATNVLIIPAALPLILLIFWMFRIRFANAYKRRLVPAAGTVYSVRT
jgi:uncharacterized membrane protein